MRARLAVKRNPAAKDPRAPLVLDGDEVQLESAAIDGRTLAATEYATRRGAPDHPVGARCVHPRHGRAHRAAQEHEADGAVRLEGRLLHPVRGGGLPPHHVLRRPAGRDGALHDDDPRRPREVSGAAVEREPGRAGRRGGRPALGEVGRPVPEAVLPLRDGRREARQARGHVRHALGPEGDAAGVGGAGQGRPVRLGDAGAQEIDEVGRGHVRPRGRPRLLHDRRGRRLQHGRDGEQGPQHLQHQVRPRPPRHRDRRRLPQHRPGRRPRVLPQLDRQPRHLPRLVPAVAEGGPHRLPRPGVRRRHLLAPGDAHPGSARPARGAVPRGRRPDGAPGAPAVVHGDLELLHRHRVREGRGGGADDPHAHRARARSGAGWTSTSGVTTARR